MIPVPNTGRPDDQRLRKTDFNRELGNETLYNDRLLSFVVEQVHRGPHGLLEVRGNDLYLGGDRFGALPIAEPSDGFGLLYVRLATTVPAPDGKAAIPARHGRLHRPI